MGKKIAIGCGIAFVLGMAGLYFACTALMGVVEEGMVAVGEMAEEAMAEEADRQQLVASWSPPAEGAGSDELFPAEVGDARLVSNDEQAAIRDFAVTMDGLHGVYSVGTIDVEVFAYQATEADKDAVFGEAKRQHDRGGIGVRVWSSNDYLIYYVSPDHGQNHMWYMKGWLFVFRTTASEEVGAFVKEYLRAVSAESPTVNDQ